MPRDFLATRLPPAPLPLATWLGRVAMKPGTGMSALLGAGLSELDAARAAPGRVRASAFHLLAADALLTYACEAALEAEDPRRALADVLHRAAAPRP